MQKEKKPRAGFGTLLANGWMTYRRGMGASVPATLLCVLLPALIVTVTVYYCLAAMFQPVLQVLQAIVNVVLQNGFDEWAVGAAVEQTLLALGALRPQELVRQVLGSAGWMVVVLAIMAPLQVVFRYVLTPIGQGAMALAHGAGVYGVKMAFHQAMRDGKGRIGKILVLNLVYTLGTVVLYGVGSVLAGFVALLPVIGVILSVLIVMVMLCVGFGVRDLMLFVGLNENKWHFVALFEAVKRYFTDWAYICAGLIFLAGLALGVCMVAVLDALVMVLAMFPPVLTLLLIAFSIPLLQALTCAIYDDQRKRLCKK